MKQERCENMTSLGENLKKFRTDLGLTQEEVATTINIKKATYSKYETGKVKNISSNNLAILADLFNTTPEILMGWEREYTDEDRKKFDLLMKNPRLNMVFDAAESLSPKDLDFIFNMAEQMVENLKNKE